MMMGGPVPIRDSNGNQIGSYNRSAPLAAAGIGAGAATMTAAVAASAVVPGPEDAVIAAAGATQVGKAVSGAIGKTANALMNKASPNAIAKATEGIADAAPSTAKPGDPVVSIGSRGEVNIVSDGRGPTTAGRGDPVGITGKTEAAISSAERAQNIQNVGERIEQGLQMVQDACAPDGCLN